MYGTVAVALRRTRVLLRLLQLYLQQDLRKIRNKSASMIGIVKRVRAWVVGGGCGCVDEEGRAHDDMHILVCVLDRKTDKYERRGWGGGQRRERMGADRFLLDLLFHVCALVSVCLLLVRCVCVRVCV